MHRKWEFGDGNSTEDGNSTDDALEPNAQNPRWTFRVPGTYTARLTVSNPFCRNETPASSLYTISIGAAPVAALTKNTSSGQVSFAVQFTDQSTAATSWYWTFGDGTSATTQNPVHTYTRGGAYTVVLKASNSYGDSPRAQSKQRPVKVSRQIRPSAGSGWTTGLGGSSLPLIKIL